ncbi:MAG TPA: MYXO-CTERM sorting domain-containing protein [Anaeromyxobacteraceae bacterium]|nr:MYXO-CTERM sorting domain-containing protein [Anaeromyxobacteraceae bacterium]
MSEFTFDPPQVELSGSQQLTVKVTHTGSKAPIQLTGASLTPANTFTIVTQPTWPVTLATGQSATLVVALATTTAGTYDGALDLSATSCADDVSVGITGKVEAGSTGTGGGGGGGGCNSAGVVGGWFAIALAALAALKRRRS